MAAFDPPCSIFHCFQWTYSINRRDNTPCIKVLFLQQQKTTIQEVTMLSKGKKNKVKIDEPI